MGTTGAPPALPNARGPMTDALLRQHFARLGPVELVNEYGPTETTVWASMRRYQQAGPVDLREAYATFNMGAGFAALPGFCGMA